MRSRCSVVLLALGLIFGGVTFARGQGLSIVRFANDFLSGVNAPFYDIDGTTRLSGPSFRAALYAGPVNLPPENWQPVGVPQPFGTNAAAGFWTSRDFPLPFPAPDGMIGLQVRFWDSVDGAFATFEQAAVSTARTGVSRAIMVILNPPGIPTPMAGLQSAALVPIVTLTRGAPGIITTTTSLASGTQLTMLCGVQVGPNRWLRVTSPYAGEAVITTAGSSIDTVMSAYTGSIISPSTLTLVTCNDDRTQGMTASEVRFPVEANRLYLICTAGKHGVTGNIRVNHMLATSLLIRRSDPGWIELSWPADATNCFLEKTTSFLEPASWTAITNPPLTLTNRKVLHLEGVASGEVYRLRVR